MASCSRCCGSSADAEDLLHLRGNPGPKVDRHCTDPICCLLFLVVIGATGVLLSVLWQVGDVRRINHGRDHDGNLCGLGEMEKKPFLFYPDLDTDFKNDPTLSGMDLLKISEDDVLFLLCLIHVHPNFVFLFKGCAINFLRWPFRTSPRWTLRSLCLRMRAGRTGGGRLWPCPADFVAGASALFSCLPALLAISKAHGESEY